jgi:hypothetical protein
MPFGRVTHRSGMLNMLRLQVEKHAYMDKSDPSVIRVDVCIPTCSGVNSSTCMQRARVRCVTMWTGPMPRLHE